MHPLSVMQHMPLLLCLTKYTRLIVQPVNIAVECAAAGPVEVLFVVDSKSDAACPAIQRLLAEGTPVLAARILVAPVATTHSQKIANLLTGIQVCMRSWYLLAISSFTTDTGP